MDNRSVINAFANGKAGRSSNNNLRTDGTRLVNYGTCIAQRLANGMIVFNATKYSVTTSKIQTWALCEVTPSITVTNVPLGAYDLTRYIK